MPSLQAIAAALGGRVVRGRSPHVAAPYPGSKKKLDRSLHVFINGDDIGVHVFRDGVDPIAVKDHVRRVCGLPAWQPKPKTKPKPAVPYSVRNHFFGETLAVCRLRRKITAEQFALLMNDLRLRGDAKDAVKYTHEFGFGPADLERCMATTPRHYTADERATILNLTYRDRQQLGLRRTGSIDVDKAGRDRARRDRYNAKRRASRAAARLPGVNKRCPVEGRPSSNQKEEKDSTSVVEKGVNLEGKTWLASFSRARALRDQGRHHAGNAPGGRMIEKIRELMELYYSGTVIDGAGDMLCGPGGDIVGWYIPTIDGLHHILDAETGSRLDVFASKDDAFAFARSYWKRDGSIDPSVAPNKRLQ